MTFDFQNLNERARQLMLDEIDLDTSKGPLFKSTRFTAAGSDEWERMLRDACEHGDESTLAVALGKPGGPYLNAQEPNPKTPGFTKAVRRDAADLLAGSEFNRFYIRALCVLALAEGAVLEIYRARSSRNPDPTSESKVGTEVDSSSLLEDLRTHQGVATALGLPAQPNSGLSVRLK